MFLLFFVVFFIGDYFQLILHFKFHGRFIIDNTYFNFEMNFLLWAFFLGGGGGVGGFVYCILSGQFKEEFCIPK